uniref:Ig-like domain-containing protein n=1 Tax=Cyprinus carpio carpio TaxID=630221 RepID=A0A8C1I115_CYPCA
MLADLFAGASNGDTIKPDKTEEFVAEGSSVNLSCSYSSAWSLLWYRQYPGSAPEFLVLTLDGEKEAQTSKVDQRFSTNNRKEEQNRVDLIISSVAVSDSALYYCALSPTVTGNTRTLLALSVHENIM